MSTWFHMISWPRTLLLITAIAAVLLVLLRALRGMKPAQRAVFAAWASKNAQELVGIPAAFLLFWISGIILTAWDASSRPFDPAVLQVIPIVLCHLIVGNSIARFGTNINIDWFNRDGNSKMQRKWLYVIYLAAYCALASAV